LINTIIAGFFMKRKLSAENIDIVAIEIEEFLSNAKIDKKEQLRIRLGVEEALLNFKEFFGEDKDFDVRLGKLFGKVKVAISVAGERFDPFAMQDGESDESVLMRSMLTTLGKRPTWTYSRKINNVVFNVEKRKLPSWCNLAIAIALAVICGLSVRSFPEGIKTFIQTDLFTPLLNTFVGFLNAVAGPMIFLAVVWGIYSMGDANTFSTIGKKLTIRFGIYITLISGIACVLALPFFNLKYGETTGGSGFSSVYQMVLDIIPSNLFTPFSRGNSLQILFVAIIIGIAMIMIGDRTQHIAILSEQLNLIVQGIMGVVSKLVPFYIFGSLFNIIVESDINSLFVAGKFFFGTLACCAFMIIAQTILTSILTKTSPAVLWKRSLNTFLIALTTASSSAAFSINVTTCKGKYGMDEKLANFGVPFAQVLYKPAVCVIYFIAAVSMAESYEITVSASWVITALIMCIILSAATPPIPGGTIASFSVVFTQLGVPVESLAVILGLNVILDFIGTATNVICDQFMIVDEAGSGK